MLIKRTLLPVKAPSKSERFADEIHIKASTAPREQMHSVNVTHVQGIFNYDLSLCLLDKLLKFLTDTSLNTPVCSRYGWKSFLM